ncbi:hypothetical protein GOP47_0005072 [Adiantum capillus-veneris]|uniref:Lysine-specific demethylase JMJ25 n=1 Tax=Adiantum capillus-veneris TaxID=13818 RepID=A0A9D4V5J6_ADICA|nr:hypothetical protein GOP47_0005072 [Adiantum capillus-veneris]
MNRGRKGGGGNRVDEDIPDELRCKRSDGKQWRCNARAMENKTLCEKHYNQAKKRAAGANANTSPKKKTKAKEGASPEVLQLSRAAIDTRNKVSNRGVAERSSKAYNSGPFSAGDFRINSDHRHANYKHADYRPSSDYRHPTDHKGPSNGRQRFLNGSSRKLEDRPRPRRSPGRDSYFKDEPVHLDEEMDQQSDICHQCQKNDRGELISCLQCGKKSYCVHCISRWYPNMHEDDVRQSCPHCRGICNCKACIMLDGGGSIFSEMKVVNDLDKVKFLKYMLSFIQPLLQQLHDEQCQEFDLEINLTGDEGLKAERSKLMKDERLYCDNCTTSIVDLYRSCLSCGYDLCLTCCRELRQGKQPGGELAGSADQPSIARMRGSSGGNESKLPVWHANDDSSIPCPPAERGGCATSSLVLKRILKSNWIAKLAAEVNSLASTDQTPPLASGARCACRVESDAAFSFESLDKHLRQASHRSDKDNYVYCPTAKVAEREGLEHFQKHWLRGEPVIVRGIFEETQGLNWEPLVLWRALRDSTRSKSMGALDCLDWCLVEVSINQFFKGYQEGRIRRTGWPELLKMRDPLSASVVEERLPRLGVQLIRSLPFHEYTNVRHGVLNLASKIPDDCLRPDYGPKASIAYGLREELGRGDSVTKLHYDMSDTVMVLAHSTEVKLPAWQSIRLDKFKTEYKKASAAEAVRSGDQSAATFSTASHDERTTPASSNGVIQQGMMLTAKEEAVKVGLAESISGSEDSRILLKQETLGEKNRESEKENAEPSVVQSGESREPEIYGGVLWDIFRRQDVPMLQAYLLRHCKEFRHTNEDVVEQVSHPIYDQTFYLSKEHKKKLKDEFGELRDCLFLIYMHMRACAHT